jgi:hypothetical protein
MFSAPRLIFGGTYGCRLSISCFALPDSFSAVPRPSGPVLMFCARTRFRRYRGRQVPFSCFALPDSFSMVPRASYPVFIFCVPELVFGGTEVVGSCFHVLRSRNHFRRYRGRWLPFSCFPLPNTFLVVLRASGAVFMFCAPGLVFGGTEGVGFRFHVLSSLTLFQRYRGCLISFICFARPDSF